jgi:hypothetical protein
MNEGSAMPGPTMKVLFAKYGGWLCAALGCLCIALGIEYTSLELRTHFADAQIGIFQAMEGMADQYSDPPKVTGLLKYVIDYYPSGTQQATGTPLDHIVEDERSRSVAAIINRLRVLYGTHVNLARRSALVRIALSAKACHTAGL